jgi:hypothetical protein
MIKKILPILFALYLLGSNITLAQTEYELLSHLELQTRIYDTDLSNDGHFLATVESSKVTIYETETWAEIAHQPIDMPYAIAWNMEGTRLAVGKYDGEVQIYSWTGSELELEISLSTPYWQKYIDWSPDDAYLIGFGVYEEQQSYTELLTMYTWDTSTWELLPQLPSQFIMNTEYSSGHIFDWIDNEAHKIAILASLGHIEDDLVYGDSSLQLIMIDVATTEIELTIPIEPPFGYALTACRNLIAISTDFDLSVLNISTNTWEHFPTMVINSDTLSWDSSCRYIAVYSIIYDVEARAQAGLFELAGQVIDTFWLADNSKIIFTTWDTDSRTSHIYVFGLTKNLDRPNENKKGAALLATPPQYSIFRS